MAAARRFAHRLNAAARISSMGLSAAMPLVNLRIAAAPDRELAARAADRARHRRAARQTAPLIAIAVDFVDPATWFVAGHARRQRARPGDQGHRRTNTKAEKARFIASVFASFEQLFGPLHEEATSHVHDARAASYGYGGRTQEWRYQRQQA